MSDALLEAVEGLHVSELELAASRQAAARQAAARQAAGPWRGLSRPRQAAAATNEVREAALVDKQAAPRGDSGLSTSASANEEEGGAAAPAEGRSGRLEIMRWGHARLRLRHLDLRDGCTDGVLADGYFLPTCTVRLLQSWGSVVSGSFLTERMKYRVLRC